MKQYVYKQIPLNEISGMSKEQMRKCMVCSAPERFQMVGNGTCDTETCHGPHGAGVPHKEKCGCPRCKD